VYEAKSQTLFFAFVDKNGIYHSHQILKYLGMPNADQHVDSHIRIHYKEDEKKIKVKFLSRTTSKRPSQTLSSFLRTVWTPEGSSSVCANCSTTSLSPHMGTTSFLTTSLSSPTPPFRTFPTLSKRLSVLCGCVRTLYAKFSLCGKALTTRFSTSQCMLISTFSTKKSCKRPMRTSL
jgi:hypothetical protein